MGRLVTVARAEDVPRETGLECTVEGRIIALFRVGDAILALDGICPHAGGPLGQGRLEGCIVTCPWHGWQFDVTTGTHCLTPRIRQNQYPVRVSGGEVQVEIPD